MAALVARWPVDRVPFADRKANSDIYVMKSDGGIPKRLTHGPANDAAASWSRDGRWIYFASDRSGDRQVWKMRFEPDLPMSPAEPIQVTKGGGNTSLESPDGKMLYYSKGFSSFGVFRPGGGEERQVLESVGMNKFRSGVRRYILPGANRSRQAREDSVSELRYRQNQHSFGLGETSLARSLVVARRSKALIQPGGPGGERPDDGGQLETIVEVCEV